MLKIKEAAERLHMNPNTLRFYEKKGLVTPYRDGNGYRMYTEGDIARLQMVLLYRRMGFSVEMVLELLEKEESTVDLFFRQYDTLNRHIHSMRLIRDSLEGCIDRLLEEKGDTQQMIAGMEQVSKLLASMGEWEDRWDFDGTAAHYDRMVRQEGTGLPFYRNYDRVLDRAAQLVREHGGAVAEIGVGTGELAGRRLSDLEIVGIDQSVNMLKEAKRKFPELRVKLGTFLQLPLETGGVDVIVTSYAFHHCNEKEKVLAVKEMVRVLRPGGRIVIADLMFADAAARAAFEERCSEEELADLKDEFFAPVDGLESMLEAAGFFVTKEQVDELIWIVTGDRRDG